MNLNRFFSTTRCDRDVLVTLSQIYPTPKVLPRQLPVHREGCSSDRPAAGSHLHISKS
ncbi:hypothetical protein PAXRUDRAFT_824946 [Paxillus rubicundulus Ve08.2h10]|uniref:Uncharacterized protein n=1 Tax=Paxillus rubicundulus Ve08.2h10 TaxID=930991 RepID=A0A0D0DH40_9AGAM|nr:hypothetical protein PAXRUDRAFT_824946 [Paxillus rubicundulus Ve08.2h10]